MELIHRKELTNIKRVVVKVGSKILTPQNANEHLARMSGLIHHFSQLIDNGVQVIFISSGAIAHGSMMLNLKERPKTIPLKQACAGVGQIELMNLYRRKFQRHNKQCGQILLSWDDLRNKERYLNLRNTLFAMLANGITPIINENDSVAVDEIKIGDNDTLAAQIALVSNADLFITLTDINGLYTSNPKTNPEAKHIPLVEDFHDALHDGADEDGTDVGVGGMVTKLRAAEMVSKAGIAGIIGDGYNNELLDVINNPQLGTLFLPQRDRMDAKERFIAFSDSIDGRIIVDEGAFCALSKNGKSLLSAGITSVDGPFEHGDTVELVYKGTRFAKGIVDYSSTDIDIIKGHTSEEIKALLGSKRYDYVIHRNNMVILH